MSLQQSRENSMTVVAANLHNKSCTSQVSHNLSYIDSLPAVITDEELVDQVNKKKLQVQVLKLENEILERVIMRLDPALMHGVYQALEYATKRRTPSFQASRAAFGKFGGDLTTVASRVFATSSRITAWKTESSAILGGSVTSFGPRKININEKLELLATETQIIGEKKRKFEERAHKKHALYTAYFEEIETRIEDIRKAKKEFTDKVINEGFDRITQRIPAEVWVRFLTEFVKSHDKQIDKMRLRTTTLNQTYFKLKNVINDKAELAAKLVPVDFEEIEIRNTTAQRRLEDQLEALCELKQITGEANLLITIHNKVLYAQDTYLGKVLAYTKQRGIDTVKLTKEAQLMQEQAAMYEEKLEKVRAVRMKYKVPDVLEYLRVKILTGELNNSIKVLESKIQKRLSLFHEKRLLPKKTASQGKSMSSVQTLPSAPEITPHAREKGFIQKLPLMTYSFASNSYLKRYQPQ